MLMHVARPVKGAKGMCDITIISQVNTHSRSPAWLHAFTGESGSRALGVLHKDDLVRELKTTGKNCAWMFFGVAEVLELVSCSLLVA